MSHVRLTPSNLTVGSQQRRSASRPPSRNAAAPSPTPGASGASGHAPVTHAVAPSGHSRSPQQQQRAHAHGHGSAQPQPARHLSLSAAELVAPLFAQAAHAHPQRHHSEQQHAESYRGSSPTRAAPAAARRASSRPPSRPAATGPSHADQYAALQQQHDQQLPQRQRRQSPPPASSRAAAASAYAPPPTAAVAAMAVPIPVSTRRPTAPQAQQLSSAHHTAITTRQLAQQRGVLQTQRQRHSSPPPPPSEPFERDQGASSSRDLPLPQPQPQPQAQSSARARSHSTSRPQRLLSAEALEEHERAIRASEAAANAPSPLVRSPSSRVLGRGDPAAALPALAIQSELHALDQQIRQSTQELVLLQQQQHLQSLQMQQATIHAQMQQSQSQSQPPSRANSRPSSALPYAEQLQQQLLHQHSTPSAQLQLQQQQGNSWYRGPSPSPGTGQGTARSFSPPPHSHRSSGGVDNEVLLAAAAGASSRSNAPTPAPPAATAISGAPSISRNNPFVSLVDAIDSVMAKSVAAPVPQQQFAQQVEPAHPSPHLSAHAHNMQAAQQLLQQTFQNAQAQAQAQAQAGYAPNVPPSLLVAGGPVNALSHSSSSGGQTRQSYGADSHDGDDADAMGAFDDHPELVAQNSVESLRLSNALLREKGSELLGRHRDLRVKFKAVRALLSEYYRKKDREVALVLMASAHDKMVARAQGRALHVWHGVARDARQRQALQRASLAALLRRQELLSRSRRAESLRRGFAQWKEVAIRLAMRAVQNQWMRDWEADLAFEARRTALASVLLRAQHRAAQAAQADLLRAMHTWRMASVHERVKAIFSAHTQTWQGERQQLLGLLLEGNEAREAAAGALSNLQQEHAALRTSYDALARNAAHQQDIAAQAASVSQSALQAAAAQAAAQVAAQAEAQRTRRDRERAARSMVAAIEAAAGRRCARAMHRWSRNVAAQIRHDAARHFQQADQSQLHGPPQLQSQLHPPHPQQLQPIPTHAQPMPPAAAATIAAAPIPQHAAPAEPSASHEAESSLAARLAATRIQHHSMQHVQQQQQAQQSQSFSPFLQPAHAPLPQSHLQPLHPPVQPLPLVQPSALPAQPGAVSHAQQLQQQQPKQQYLNATHPSHHSFSHADVTLTQFGHAPAAHAHPNGAVFAVPPPMQSQQHQHQQQQQQQYQHPSAQAQHTAPSSLPPVAVFAPSSPSPLSPLSPHGGSVSATTPGDLIQPPLHFDGSGGGAGAGAGADANGHAHGPLSSYSAPPPSTSVFFASPTLAQPSPHHAHAGSVSAVGAAIPFQLGEAVQPAFSNGAAPVQVGPPLTPTSSSSSGGVGVAMSPSRQTLVSSVFVEFERALQLRLRAAGAAGGHGLALDDVAKAIRKVGLRSGDLRTAKMPDAAVHALVAQQGWKEAHVITAEQFTELAVATLFQH